MLRRKRVRCVRLATRNTQPAVRAAWHAPRRALGGRDIPRRRRRCRPARDPAHAAVAPPAAAQRHPALPSPSPLASPLALLARLTLEGPPLLQTASGAAACRQPQRGAAATAVARCCHGCLAAGAAWKAHVDGDDQVLLPVQNSEESSGPVAAGGLELSLSYSKGVVGCGKLRNARHCAHARPRSENAGGVTWRRLEVAKQRTRLAFASIEGCLGFRRSWWHHVEAAEQQACA